MDVDKILQKFAEQAKKTARMEERELNRTCVICKKSMRENGFSTIPRICKKCENEEVHR